MIFSTPKRCKADPKANEITALKKNSQLFGKLYIPAKYVIEI